MNTEQKEFVVKVFGKKDCDICKIAKDKLQSFITETNLGEKSNMIFYDLDTTDGMTEGSLLDALDVPTIIIEKNEQEIARWAKYIPGTATLKKFFD